MRKIFIIQVLFISYLFSSCSEQYNLQTNTYEEALVVEATITNEFKNQEVKISKTYRLEEHGPTAVSGAMVYVTDNLGNQYSFLQNAGIYESVNPFQAIAGRSYSLHFTTSNGKSYISSVQTLTTVSPIQNITPNVVVIDGVKGVELSVNSFDPANTSKFYRFEYEETYKIIVPKYSVDKLVVTGAQSMDLVPRTLDVRTCFSTKKSNNIILTSTNDLSEDRVNFPIRFISSKDFIISNRYSILAKQFVQSLASYTFYKTLKQISGGSGSILSQNQPGFLTGNISSLTDANEKVIGFFDVSSVSTKRIFFNFNDIFPSDPLPKYLIDCSEEEDPPLSIRRKHNYCFVGGPNSTCTGDNIIGLIQSKLEVYYSGTTLGPVPTTNTTLELYPIQCGDCSSFSSTIRPTFWID